VLVESAYLGFVNGNLVLLTAYVLEFFSRGMQRSRRRDWFRIDTGPPDCIMAAIMMKLSPTENRISLPRSSAKKRTSCYQLLAGFWGLLLFLLPTCAPRSSLATGVTIITHGYDSNADDWVRGMADQIPNYYRFPGTNFTTYKLTLTTDGTYYYYQWARTNGSAPAVTDSGEIIVKLDWSQMAGGTALYDISTYDVAGVASWVFQQTNSFTDLGGHALAEFPIHLVGHSRGGSLMNEISRLLGTNGVWVDHLTTLDPHPLNNDGNVDLFFPTDASAASTYANVLFRDDYWQNLGDGLITPNGEPASGAYDRQLYTLSGGYSSSHSDVHLWYHGTIDWRNPAFDNAASITSAERASWWVPYEDQGVIAGFYYSLIGGGNRLSADQPIGQGFPAIRDGYNQAWDLGAGTSANRASLAANNGSWPNLIKFNRIDTNQVVQGQSTSVKFFYQWAQPNTTNATVSFYIDDDFNPLNTNQKLLKQMSVPGNGASSISYGTASLTLDATNAAPGYHALYAKITGGGRTRYLYAPELVQVVSIRQAPTLDLTELNASQFRIGVSGLVGQTIVLQNSTNLQTWLPLATNTLAGSRWVSTNSPPSSPGRRFYRAVLSP
jgi:hypothetical protein